MASSKSGVFLSLGANLGDREANLKRALELLGEAVKITRVSSIYETEPVGNNQQPRFLNLVCEIKTALSPEALLEMVKLIEARLGRTSRTGEPRPIDIDIILYGDSVIKTPTLQIPHPRMDGRAFVLVPLAEIAPDAIHPTSGRTARELRDALGKVSGVVRRKGRELNCTR